MGGKGIKKFIGNEKDETAQHHTREENGTRHLNGRGVSLSVIISPIRTSIHSQLALKHPYKKHFVHQTVKFVSAFLNHFETL